MQAVQTRGYWNLMRKNDEAVIRMKEQQLVEMVWGAEAKAARMLGEKSRELGPGVRNGLLK